MMNRNTDIGRTIISWNVNGLRSNIFTSPGEKYNNRPVGGVQRPLEIKQDSNFSRLVEKYHPDIVCFQESRCDQKVFDAISNIQDFGFTWKALNCSTSVEKGRGSGYSGTAIFSKTEPINVTKGLPDLEDTEGRCITCEFIDIFLVNVYTPNSGTNEEYRISEWDPAMARYLNELKQTGKDVILVGDMNVCREEIDIFSGFPPESQRIAGLLPEERYGINRYIQNGFVDSFRYMYPDEDEGFTWWNQRIKSFREQNKGWRIDYALTSNIDNCLGVDIARDIMGSDHCPIMLKIK